jgi:hypothetical protein
VRPRKDNRGVDLISDALHSIFCSNSDGMSRLNTSTIEEEIVLLYTPFAEPVTPAKLWQLFPQLYGAARAIDETHLCFTGSL